MSYDTPELTDQEVLQHAYSTLQEHLPLQAHGYTCTTADLLKVLLGVAVTRGTSESVCADLVGTPDPQTIRGYLKSSQWWPAPARASPAQWCQAQPLRPLPLELGPCYLSSWRPPPAPALQAGALGS